MKANPPLHRRIPKELLNNREVAEFYEGFLFDMFLLWQKVGGGRDFIEEALQGLYEFDDLTKIDVKQALIDEVVVINADHTTATSETVICDAELTVFLNAEPDDREKAKILVTNGDVTIDGNGKKLNKKDSQKVIFKNLVTLATVDCLYVIELDEWFIV